ncbi:MAG: hypothetical protein PVG81_00205 [Desulfobacterales bacterium]|jgi:hypothetical protein
MWALLDRIPYPLLILLAVFMLLAPFRPMPHVLEKLIMLKNGALNRPVDIFDLFYHLLPTILLALKIYRTYSR